MWYILSVLRAQITSSLLWVSKYLRFHRFLVFEDPQIQKKKQKLRISCFCSGFLNNFKFQFSESGRPLGMPENQQNHSWKWFERIWVPDFRRFSAIFGPCSRNPRPGHQAPPSRCVCESPKSSKILVGFRSHGPQTPENPKPWAFHNYFQFWFSGLHRQDRSATRWRLVAGSWISAVRGPKIAEKPAGFRNCGYFQLGFYWFSDLHRLFPTNMVHDSDSVASGSRVLDFGCSARK